MAVALSAAWLAVGPAQQASAQRQGASSAASFFRGKTLDFVVPYNPGGGYDAYARMLLPFLERYTGSTVVIRNEPGAGSLLATNRTYVSRPDGLRIQIVNGVGAASAQIAQQEGVRFDLRRFSWVGRVASEPRVMVVSAQSSLRTFRDVLGAGRTIRFSATGPGSSDYIDSVVVGQIFGVPVEIITGFDSSAESEAAVIRGDVDSFIGTLDSRLPAIRAGETRPLVLFGRSPHPALPGVPTLFDFNVPPDRSAILRAHVGLLEMGRPLVAPPGLPPDRLAFLRDAFEKAMSDPELLRLSEQQNRPLSYLPGEGMEQVVRDVLDAPAPYRDLIRQSSGA